MAAITSAQWKTDHTAKRSGVIKIPHRKKKNRTEMCHPVIRQRRVDAVSAESRVNHLLLKMTGRETKQIMSTETCCRQDAERSGPDWQIHGNKKRNTPCLTHSGEITTLLRRDGWETDLQVNRRRSSRQVSGWLDDWTRRTVKGSKCISVASESEGRAAAVTSWAELEKVGCCPGPHARPGVNC